MSKAITELQRYLEDDVMPTESNPLEWWRNHYYNYSNLSLVVPEKLCAVASSVPYERVVSQAGLILSERRNRLSAKKAQILLFLKCNNKIIAWFSTKAKLF